MFKLNKLKLQKYFFFFFKEDNLNPLKIEFEGKIIAFSTGKSHALILDDKNNVYGWGNNNHGQVGIGFNQDKF